MCSRLHQMDLCCMWSVLCIPFTRMFIVCLCVDWHPPIQHCGYENTQNWFYTLVCFYMLLLMPSPLCGCCPFPSTLCLIYSLMVFYSFFGVSIFLLSDFLKSSFVEMNFVKNALDKNYFISTGNIVSRSYVKCFLLKAILFNLYSTYGLHMK